MAKRARRLEIRNFAQIARAEVELGDLTVLVGPQATGKSLTLQLFKLALDGQRVARELDDNGFSWSSAADFAGHVFGEGTERAWRKDSEVTLNAARFDLQSLSSTARKLSSAQKVFYIPAQRALTVINGWPESFSGGPLGTPYVVRRFSEMLAKVLRSAGAGSRLFPQDGKLKETLRVAIDKAVFHGAPLELRTVRGRTELRLAFGDETLPTIAWTAGQREFVPLLVALYALIPAGKKTKDADVDWIVLEEPEMSLHPHAILAVMLLVLELLSRGYKVILSTHHPLVLDVIWGLSRIQRSSSRGKPRKVLELFGLGDSTDLRALAVASLEKTYRVTSFDFQGQSVVTKDISDLDPGADDEAVAGWGGLSGLSGRIGDVVAGVADR